MLQHSAPNISIIFGYPKLPINHPEDPYLSPVLPNYFFDPDVIRGGAEVLSRTEQHFGLHVGIAFSILLLFKTFWPSKVIAGVNRAQKSKNSLNFEKFLIFLAGSTMMPLFLFFATAFLFYRFFVHTYLQITLGKNYAGLLKGPDVLWALSTKEAKSVVNVLVLVEVPPPLVHTTQPAIDFQQFIKKIASRSLLCASSPFPKLLYRRRKSVMGYHFWLKCEGSRVEDYVRSLRVKDNGCETISESELQDVIGQHSNDPFPFDDTATWELLVGDKPLQSTETIRQFPIIFRVHHSVGDGVALLRLLLEGLADKSGYKDLPAKTKQKVWAETHSKTGKGPIADQSSETELLQDLIEKPIYKHPIINAETDLEPTVTVNTAEEVIRFRRQSEFGTDIPQQKTVYPISPKKTSINKLRTSFRFLKHNTLQASQNLPPVNSQPDLSAKPYSPIKGLGGGSPLFSKLSAIRRTASAKCISGNTSTISSKTTCIVFPQLHTEKKKILEMSNNSLAAMKVFPEKHEYTKYQYPTKAPEPSSKRECNDCVFKKCNNYKTEVGLNAILTTKEQRTLSKNTIRHLQPLVNDKKISVRDLIINFAISIIAGTICIKNSLSAITEQYLRFLIKAFKISYEVPYILYNQTFSNTNDRLLYGRRLSGKKVVSWIVEKDETVVEDLLKSKISNIRERFGGNLKFSDILMTCVSRSLERFYRRHGNYIPISVNVVIPARVNYDDLTKGLETTSIYQTANFKAKVTRLYSSRKALKPPFKWHNMSFNSSTESEPEEVIQGKTARIHAAMVSHSKMEHKVKLENKFTVAVLKLPINSSAAELKTVNEDIRFVRKIQAQCLQLRNAPDYTLNYMLLRWVAHLFPYFLLRCFLNGGPCTLVLSNMPGPEDPTYLQGKPIRNIVFWIPNRGLNGLGIGILSYCGRFSMGVVADETLIPNKELAHEIIQGIFDEVDRLHSHKVRNSHRPIQSNQSVD